MPTQKLMIGIENEFEGDTPQWFDLSEPEVFANYLRDNIDLGVKREFRLAKMTDEEIAALE